MTARLDDIIAKLPPARRARVASRTQELVAEEMALRELRKAFHLTQEGMAFFEDVH